MKNLLSDISNHSQRKVGIKITAAVIDIYVAITVSSERASPPWEELDLLKTSFSQKYQEFTEEFAHEEDLASAFCRGIVEAHGGRMMSVQGDNGHGTMFTFTLPTSDEAPILTAQEEDAVSGFDVSTDTSNAKILVAVPDARTLGVVRRILSASDLSVIATYDLNEVDALALAEKPQVVVLDLAVATGNEFQLIRHLWQEFGIPVIVLSEKGEDESVARAFDAGADDYVVKPFSPTELMVRIKSCVRKRAAQRSNPISYRYAFKDVFLDYNARTLRVYGSMVPLTATEYKLIYELSSNAGQILTQDELLHRVWGQEYTGEPQLLRSYIKSLRQKLGDNARSPSYIFTEHGIGYRMAKQ